MTKYVVSGYIGFNNFGDEAIAYVLTQKLRAGGAEKITLISSNPKETSKKLGVDSCGMFEFLLPLIKSDVLISGGGSLLQDVTSLKSLLYYLGVIFSALILNKRVEIFAQGIGPVNSFFGRLLTKFALKRASKITVRDAQSHSLLKEWGISSELVKDPIFGIDISQKEKKDNVIIQLRQFKGVDEEFLKRLAIQVAEHFSDKEILILSLQDSIDKSICNQFSDILQTKGKDSKVISGLDVSDVIQLISGAEFLISMRFHAIVIGIKSGAKILAINYDPKVEKLAKEYDLPYIELNQKDISQDFISFC